MATITDTSRVLTLECEYDMPAGDGPRYTISFVDGVEQPEVVAVFQGVSIEAVLKYIDAIDFDWWMYRVSPTTTLYILGDQADVAKLRADALGYNRPETAPEATLAE